MSTPTSFKHTPLEQNKPLPLNLNKPLPNLPNQTPHFADEVAEELWWLKYGKQRLDELERERERNAAAKLPLKVRALDKLAHMVGATKQAFQTGKLKHTSDAAVRITKKTYRRVEYKSQRSVRRTARKLERKISQFKNSVNPHYEDLAKLNINSHRLSDFLMRDGVSKVTSQMLDEFLQEEDTTTNQGSSRSSADHADQVYTFPSQTSRAARSPSSSSPTQSNSSTSTHTHPASSPSTPTSSESTRQSTSSTPSSTGVQPGTTSARAGKKPYLSASQRYSAIINAPAAAGLLQPFGDKYSSVKYTDPPVHAHTNADGERVARRIPRRAMQANAAPEQEKKADSLLEPENPGKQQVKNRDIPFCLIPGPPQHASKKLQAVPVYIQGRWSTILLEKNLE